MEDISPELIRAGLHTRFIGQKILYFPSLPSTMTVARKEATRGAPEGTVVIADEQTGGRGRRGRGWLSPRGGIALSIVLRPALLYLNSLIMVSSLAVVHTIENTTGLEAGIKWPNDVLIRNKKVCGILIENSLGEGVNYSITGIGINVNIRMANLPEISSIATSLSDELGKSVSRVDIISRLLNEIERLYQGLRDGESVYEKWRARLIILGKPVQVLTGGATVIGIAESVAPDGSLLLRQPSGNLAKIVAGEVSLRPL